MVYAPPLRLKVKPEVELEIIMIPVAEEHVGCKVEIIGSGTAVGSDTVIGEDVAIQFGFVISLAVTV